MPRRSSPSSPASGDSTSPSNERDSDAVARSNSTLSVGASSPQGSPMPLDGQISRISGLRRGGGWKSRGPQPKRQPLKKLTEQMVETACREYQVGRSLGRIARIVGVTRQAMWDLLRRRLPLRSRVEALALLRKPQTAIRAKRAATLRRYRARASRITVPQMRAVKARDKTCQGSRCRASGQHYDHIISVALGGQTTLDNLQFLCQPCHRSKSREDRRLARERR